MDRFRETVREMERERALRSDYEAVKREVAELRRRNAYLEKALAEALATLDHANAQLAEVLDQAASSSQSSSSSSS